MAKSFDVISGTFAGTSTQTPFVFCKTGDVVVFHGQKRWDFIPVDYPEVFVSQVQTFAWNDKWAVVIIDNHNYTIHVLADGKHVKSYQLEQLDPNNDGKDAYEGCIDGSLYDVEGQRFVNIEVWSQKNYFADKVYF